MEVSWKVLEDCELHCRWFQAKYEHRAQNPEELNLREFFSAGAVRILSAKTVSLFQEHRAICLGSDPSICQHILSFCLLIYLSI